MGKIQVRQEGGVMPLDEERLIIVMLEALKKDYLDQCRPLIEQLTRIRSLRPHDPITITREQAEELGFIAKGDSVTDDTYAFQTTIDCAMKLLKEE
jgi:hypothetical protein